MDETTLKFYKQLLSDPCVCEWMIAMDKNNNRITRPIEALGEKKAYIALMLHENVWVVGPDQSRRRVPQRVRFATASQLQNAQVVFLTPEMHELFLGLIQKVKESLELIPPEERPKPKQLPFKGIWLTSEKGFADPGIPDHDAIFIGDVVNKNEALNLPTDAIGVSMLFSTSETRGVEIFLSCMAQPVNDALAILLEEKIAKMDEEKIPRSFRKSIKKIQGNDQETIRVLRLRSIEYGQIISTKEDLESTREFHIRWLVRGHIRNQFFPSTQDHKLIWIDPYVKGPEGKPFVESVKLIER